MPLTRNDVQRYSYLIFFNLTPHSIPSTLEKSEAAVLIIVFVENLLTTPANFKSLVASITISSELPSSWVVPNNWEKPPAYFNSTFLPFILYVPCTVRLPIVCVKLPSLVNVIFMFPFLIPYFASTVWSLFSIREDTIVPPAFCRRLELSKTIAGSSYTQVPTSLSAVATLLFENIDVRPEIISCPVLPHAILSSILPKPVCAFASAKLPVRIAPRINALIKLVFILPYINNCLIFE